MGTLNDLVSGAKSDGVETFPLEEGKFEEFFQIASDSARSQSHGKGSDSASDLTQVDAGDSSS